MFLVFTGASLNRRALPPPCVCTISPPQPPSADCHPNGVREGASSPAETAASPHHAALTATQAMPGMYAVHHCECIHSGLIRLKHNLALSKGIVVLGVSVCACGVEGRDRYEIKDYVQECIQDVREIYFGGDGEKVKNIERISDFALISSSHGQVDIKKSKNKCLTRSSKLEHLSHSQSKNVNRLNSCQNGRGTSDSHEWPCIHKSALCVYYNRVLSHSTDNVLYAGHSVCVCTLDSCGGDF